MVFAVLLVGVICGPAGNFDLTDATTHRPQRQREKWKNKAQLLSVLSCLCQDPFNMKALNFLSEISLGELSKKKL